jgi:diacylglycerol kinase (ATP)
VSPAANRYAQRIGRVLPGRLRYSLGGAAALLLAPRRLWRLRLEGIRREGRLLNMTLANGAGFGGGMMISPGSSTSDGVLELVVIGDMGLLRSLMALARLRRGGHIGMPGVTVTPTPEPVTIGAEDGPIHLEADGHDYQAQGDVEISVLPGALRLAG